MSDLISREAAIQALCSGALINYNATGNDYGMVKAINVIKALPSAEQERLTDDDFETIRIHLNAYKEKLVNQGRWKEAQEYQRIIDRFIVFASAQQH